MADQAQTARKFAWLVWGALAASSIVVLSVVIWFALQTRERAFEDSAASLRSAVGTVEQFSTAFLETIDLYLQITLAEARQAGTRQRQILNLAAADLAVLSLETVDVATGQVSAVWSRSEVPRTTAAATLEALNAFRRDPALVRYVAVANDQAGPARTVTLSRRIGQDASGLIATAEFDLAPIQRFLDRSGLAEIGVAAIYRADGLLLLRSHAGPRDVGPEIAGAALLRELVRHPAETVASATIAGESRLIAHKPLAGLPLIAVATVRTDDVLSAWRMSLMGQLVPLPIGLALLSWIAVLVTKRARLREEAERESERKSALLEATLENMDQGLMMFDAETRVQVCNARAIELLDLPADLMHSAPRFDEVTRLQFSRGEFQRTDQDVQDWIAYTGFERVLHSYERERPDGTVLEIRTVPIQDGGAVRTYTDITDRKMVEKRIAHMARHDALTGLANRLLFRERLEDALSRVQRDGTSLAVICLDLDHFKTVNDTLGHSYGDALLAEVSKRIESQLRPEDLVARLGGDEFAVLQEGENQPESASRLSERLVTVLGEPFSIEGQRIPIGVSIGVSMAPGDSLDPTQLLKNADLALYRAKGEGRGRYRRFETFMAKEVEDRRVLELDMREALSRKEFLLHFQPCLDLATNRITGFEALVRWRHPVRGMISPTEFIPVAEETGLITSLGEWVLREACAAAVTWPSDISVAVNVSAVQFRNSSVHTMVASALLATGLVPMRLELEVTESVLLGKNDACLRTLHLLRTLGVRIAMDDFGTGYSSLSYLRSYPFDKLKIDRSFVRELDNDPDCVAIVRTIAGLGASLGMTTTAEGVETEAQRELVRAAGCTSIQGFLLSRPVPAEDVPRLLGLNQRQAAA